MSAKLESTVAVVTGASSGIGRAAALRLAEEGAAVALVARRRERVEELAKAIANQGGEALVVAADVTQADAAAQLVQDSDAAALADIEKLHPEHIADAIAYIATSPRRRAINEIVIRPTDQAF